LEELALFALPHYDVEEAEEDKNNRNASDDPGQQQSDEVASDDNDETPVKTLERSNPGRQNEYFLRGDGISREVIQVEVCRYLGGDALVRPGNHNVCKPPISFAFVLALFCLTLPDQGRQGFFIRAYRNLTSVKKSPCDSNWGRIPTYQANDAAGNGCRAKT
jgi:hypothetical protein